MARLIQHFNIRQYFCRQSRRYGTSKHIDDTRQKELEAKRRAMMARGLPKKKLVKGVKRIVIVASGKGGVGKTTTAVNLSTALKLAAPEMSIGLLDTDVFGPSVPLMMNIHQKPLVNKDNLMEPLINYGVKCMSMGFLIDERSPVIWRGLMVMSALEKLLHQVAWGPLDCLIVDTPPGTGDTHLSLIQNLCVDGALLVTTPQKGALDVTRRGASMFRKLNVPIIGIVENMSSISCPACTNEIFPFGYGTEGLANDLGVQILQKIPLDEDITECCDSGKPIVLSIPQSRHAKAYKELAERIDNFLKIQPEQKEQM